MNAAWNAPDAKPLKPNVYERDYTDKGEEVIYLCRWDGQQWFGFAGTADGARFVPTPAPDQNLPWREIQGV